jgi:hypothetical protein
LLRLLQLRARSRGLLQPPSTRHAQPVRAGRCTDILVVKRGTSLQAPRTARRARRYTRRSARAARQRLSCQRLSLQRPSGKSTPRTPSAGRATAVSGSSRASHAPGCAAGSGRRRCKQSRWKSRWKRAVRRAEF